MSFNFNAITGVSGFGSTTPTFGDFAKAFQSPTTPGEAQFDAEFNALGASPDTQAPTNASADFSKMLADAIDEVSAQDRTARSAALDLALGKDIDPHTVMIEDAKASTMLHLASGIATKAAQDFQTLMNMQI